jgi:hypothetical protein
MFGAQEIVADMVFTELELLTQSLSRHCDESLEATLGACRSAAENTASSALEEFITENARLHADHAEFLAAEAEADAAFRAQVLAAKSESQAQCPTAPRQPKKQREHNGTVAAVSPPAPEPREVFDFALLSAGSRVVAEGTSDTYFPAEWSLESQLRSTLHWAGLRDTSVVHSAVQLLGVGTGRELYENLNLHKTVGVPEEALTADTHQGSCWPMKVQTSTHSSECACANICPFYLPGGRLLLMRALIKKTSLQGRSGSLTVRMAGAVFITSVSIDHHQDQRAGPSRTAPRRFEVLGIASENGAERCVDDCCYCLQQENRCAYVLCGAVFSIGYWSVEATTTLSLLRRCRPFPCATTRTASPTSLTRQCVCASCRTTATQITPACTASVCMETRCRKRKRA